MVITLQNISDYLYNARLAKNLTQQQLADRLEVTKQAVSHWETGRAIPSGEKLIKLSEVLGITVEELTGVTRPNQGNYLPKGAKRVYSARKATAPLKVLGKVHAGSLDEEEIIDKQIEIPSYVAENHPKGFLLEVVGNCMNKVIPNGAHVLVDPTKEAVNGSIVVVEDRNYEAIMRRSYRGKNTLMLIADSFDEYDDIVFSEYDEPIRLLGVVVWYQAAEELE